jgi:peptidyl-prolyl cis-trans isomerase C
MTAYDAVSRECSLTHQGCVVARRNSASAGTLAMKDATSTLAMRSLVSLVVVASLGLVAFSSWAATGPDLRLKKAHAGGSDASVQDAAISLDASAEAGSAQLPKEPVVRVGQWTQSVEQLSVALAKIPGFQLSLFGTTEAEVRRNYVDRIVVPEFLQIEKALRDKAEGDPFVRLRLRRALGNSALREEMKKVSTRDQVPKEQVEAEYKSRLNEFLSPERILVYRISVKTEAEANEILQKLEKGATFKEFGTLAREKSIDKATYLRSGELGFVSSDGKSEQGFPVDPEIFRAAKSVGDGEWVKKPIKEADNFAVVWRRGSKKAQAKMLADVEDELRSAIVYREEQSRTKAHIAELRKEHLKHLDATDLALFDIELSRDLKLLGTAVPTVVTPP